MIGTVRRSFPLGKLQTWVVIAGVLLGAAALGYKASVIWLALLVVGMGAVALLRQPVLGLLALVAAALVVPLEFGTGSAVAVNPATLLVPALVGVWVLDMVRRRNIELVPSRTNRPLLLFLLAGLFSLLIGHVTWDPFVPRAGDFIVVQFAQWAIFAFSAGAFLLTANLVRDENWLRRLTFLFLILAGSQLIFRDLPGGDEMANSMFGDAPARIPVLLVLTGLAGGQVLFNRELSLKWRLFLSLVVASTIFYSLVRDRQTVSVWGGVFAVVGVLVWLRFPRLRWPVVALVVVLAVSGILTSFLYDFAGGDAEWEESGGSRLALIGRVVEVTMRNPITGIGPAAYRPYAKMEPLLYEGAYYVAPHVSSHNNYVDLFSHVGLLGLAIFFWFGVEVTWLGFRLRRYFSQGFAAGYVNGVLAMWIAALVLMALADWILPFVYNIGFPGFRASLFVWLFAGGLVLLEQLANRDLEH